MRVALPGDAYPEPRLADSTPPEANKFIFGFQVRNLARDVRQAGFKSAREVHQRALIVEAFFPGNLARHLDLQCKWLQQPDQLDRCEKGDLCLAPHELGEKTRELDGIAQSLFGEDQQALTFCRLTSPKRDIDIWPLAWKFRQIPALFIVAPTTLAVPDQQPAKPAIAERPCMARPDNE